MKSEHKRRLAYLATVAAGLTTTVVAAGAAQAATAPAPATAGSSISASAHHTLSTYAAGVQHNSASPSAAYDEHNQTYNETYNEVISGPQPISSAAATPLHRILHELG